MSWLFCPCCKGSYDDSDDGCPFGELVDGCDNPEGCAC